MKTLDVGRTVDRLHSVTLHLLRKLRRTDVASCLNAPRLSALSVVVFAGPITLGRLAEAEQVRPPTMTRIVHALEEQGLITKAGDAEDRRTIQISATTKGRRLLLEGRDRRTRLLAKGISQLDPEAQKALLAAIGVLERMVGEI